LPKTRRRRFLREVIAAMEQIDVVLQLPDLPKIPVTFTEDERYGGYRPETEEQQRGIELSFNAPTIRLTTMHEVGHFLDDALGGFEVYSSWDTESHAGRVVAVAKQSRAVQELQSYIEQTTGQFSIERAIALNRLEPVEIWARCFAQYIALRSGDSRLRQDIQIRREIETGILQNEQWEWNDFESISLILDGTFYALNWQRPGFITLR
jgi:hypothetical protein